MVTKSNNSRTDGKIASVRTLVYYPKEIGTMLGLTKSTTYNFLNKVYETQTPFKVIKINTVIRVPKEGFDAWLKSVS